MALRHFVAHDVIPQSERKLNKLEFNNTNKITDHDVKDAVMPTYELDST